MAFVLHVYPNLVSTACFKPALNKGNIIETLQYFVVGDGFFSVFAVGVGSK